MTTAWGIFCVGLLAAPAYLILTTQPPSLWRSVIKTAPLAAFTLAAWQSGAPAYLTVALFLSALGDLALSRVGRAAFLYGLCSFALAHLVYILLFRQLGGTEAWQAFTVAPLAAIVLLLTAISSELWLAPFTGVLSWPVRVYVVLITLMGLTALTLPVGLGLVVLGAAMFICSDILLSILLFRLPEASRWNAPAARALWVLYIAGQALIVIGIAPL